MHKKFFCRISTKNIKQKTILRIPFFPFLERKNKPKKKNESPFFPTLKMHLWSTDQRKKKWCKKPK